MAVGELGGIGVGSHPAVGHVLHITPDSNGLVEQKTTRSPEDEKNVLAEGITSSVHALRLETAHAEPTMAAIMDALLMIFDDPELVDLAEPALAEGFDGSTALLRAIDSFAELMADDADFASRVGDLRAIALRIGHSLRGNNVSLTIPEEGEWIVVAKDLTPLETSQFGPSVVGVVTELGGPTSHTAIICRALGIPALVSCAGALDLPANQGVLVDPVGNRVVVGGALGEATAAISFVQQSDTPLITVRANIGSLDDAIAACKTQARGVGLFRTEVLYLDTSEAPTVDSQAQQYADVFRAAPAGKIIVRTIDAGSDKPVPFLALAREENPALGVRGFRMVGHYKEFLQSQLDAIAKAINNTGRDVGVMAPMVSTIDEVELFRSMCDAAGIGNVGIMVETPAIIPLIPSLGGLVHFLSIGTNDLSQYLFAADRLHPELGTLNSPWQPALLRQVKDIATSGTAAGMSVGVCGEAAADPLLAVVFAGMGIDSVSAATSAVGEVYSALVGVSSKDAKKAADAALLARHEADVREVVRKVLLP
jgi:phosphoenolpyruvate-protein phosphotransferase (PTS system enzyme I)